MTKKKKKTCVDGLQSITYVLLDKPTSLNNSKLFMALYVQSFLNLYNQTHFLKLKSCEFSTLDDEALILIKSNVLIQLKVP